ncbi:MarR family transcriptional regulator [uncultured Lutibacter sp.]|uniref:MarR family winged helix-turn-helix transcriptional regulator n=1 Tax=uncultured Lutibacter sp. TaxID=437739 RepID=UPI0026309681|nr:MarR family transcriptional regulator [uncultured Lutibacter sp.]
MNLDSDNSDFNKTLAPWIGRTAKILNMYISEVFLQNNIQVTKEQWIVLKILFEDNEPLIQNELAFITNRNKASLTRLINVMEKNNLVTRIPSKNDSRKNLIQITETGKLLFLKMKPLMLHTLEKMQQGITEEEKKIFFNVMTKIQFNLKKHTL